MSTHEYDEYQMFRHALRSAADSLEPQSDGLDQIRARLRHRPDPLPVAWAQATWMRLTLRLPENAFSASRLAYSVRHQVAGKLRSVSERFRGVPEPASGTLRTISQWFLSDLPEPAAHDARAGKSSVWSLLRPLAAFGVAVFIVAVGAYAAFRIPAVVSTPSGNSQQQGPGPGGGPNGGNGLNGGSSSPFASNGTGGRTAPAGRRSSSPCPPVIRPGPSTLPTPTTSPSRTTSPSPSSSSPSTSSPTPTPSTATPTPTTSPSPGGAPTAGASAGDAQATTDAVILPAQPAAPSVQTSESPCSTPSPKRTKKPPANGLSNAITSARPPRHRSKSSA